MALPGDCAKGRQGPARLVAGDHGDSDHISGNEQDAAWMRGSRHWATSAVLTGIFGLLSLFGLVLWLMGLFAGGGRLLRAVTPRGSEALGPGPRGGRRSTGLETS